MICKWLIAWLIPKMWVKQFLIGSIGAKSKIPQGQSPERSKYGSIVPSSFPSFLRTSIFFYCLGFRWKDKRFGFALLKIHSGSATQNFLPIHHFDQSNSHMKIRLENPSASLAKKCESKMKRTKICSWQSAKSKRFISYLLKWILSGWRASIVLLAIFPINF